MNNTLKQIPTPKVINMIFKKIIFGSRIHCLGCGSRNVRKVTSENRWRCKKCKSPFTIKSPSWLKGSKLSLQTIWLLLCCWQKKFSLQQTREMTELSYPTVRYWYETFRDKIPQEKPDILLAGSIACDEMYVKGDSIIGAKQKGTRNIVLKVLGEKSVNRTDAINFLHAFVKANSDLYTDGSSIYRGCGNWHKLKHTYEIHSKWQFSLTAEIEGVWGIFRTFVRRMYHHVTRYKLSKVVSEFCLRFRQDQIFNSPYDYLKICLSPKPFAL